MYKKIIALFCAAVITMFSFAACGESEGDSSATEPQDIVIETKYGELHYPGSWEDRFSYEISEADPYTVKCFAKIDEHDKISLFDVIFGEGGALIGYIKDVPVSIGIKDDTLDKTWNEGQIETYSAMKEDINYIIDSLKKIEGYKEVTVQQSTTAAAQATAAGSAESTTAAGGESAE